MLQPGDQPHRAVGALSAAGLLVAIALGSVWTAQAVVDGSTLAVPIRFVVSLAGAFYYLVMHRVATGKSLAIGRP